MHDTALARRHGTEAVGFARAAHLLGRYARRQLQFVDAHGAEILAVEPDLFVLVALQMQDLRRQQFEGAQQFATALEQAARNRGRQIPPEFRDAPTRDSAPSADRR
jgi:hypothetical protein